MMRLLFVLRIIAIVLILFIQDDALFATTQFKSDSIVPSNMENKKLFNFSYLDICAINKFNIDYVNISIFPSHIWSITPIITYDTSGEIYGEMIDWDIYFNSNVWLYLNFSIIVNIYMDCIRIFVGTSIF